MSRKTMALVGLLLCTTVVSCTKIQTLPEAETTLIMEQSASLDAIPMEYGDLVGVTPNPEGGATATLWFQGADKTITVVWVNWSRGSMSERRLIIPRR